MVMSVAAVGCGGPGKSDGGVDCTTDAECTDDQICHPTAQTCVTKCTTADDCPDDHKTCATLGSVGTGGTSQAFCQCTTDALCGTGNVCSTQDKICAESCTTDNDCTAGRSCSGGQCVTNSAACSKQGECGTGNVCDFTTGKCEAAKTCNAGEAQPSSCSYGQYCVTTTCTEVPKATCGSFGGSAHAASWGAGKNGPVIIDVEKYAHTSNDTFCPVGSRERYKIRVTAYDPAGGFPSGSCTTPGAAAGTAEAAILSELHLVNPSGGEITDGTVQCVNTTNGGKNTTFYVNYCTNDNDGYTAAVHFVDGNEACLDVTP
jgi:hypothetical protein